MCRLNRQHRPVERVSKLNKATGSKEYAGDIEGSSATEWLMAHHPDKSAVFVGLERIKGTIGGRHGSLVLQHVDTFTDGAAKATLTVVSGRRTPGRDR